MPSAKYYMPVQTFEKKGCKFKEFYKEGANLKKMQIFRPNLEGVNSVSFEKLHDFKINLAS